MVIRTETSAVKIRVRCFFVIPFFFTIKGKSHHSMIISLRLLQILTHKRDCYHAKFNGLQWTESWECLTSLFSIHSRVHCSDKAIHFEDLKRRRNEETPFHSKVHRKANKKSKSQFFDNQKEIILMFYCDKFINNVK